MLADAPPFGSTTWKPRTPPHCSSRTARAVRADTRLRGRLTTLRDDGPASFGSARRHSAAWLQTAGEHLLSAWARTSSGFLKASAVLRLRKVEWGLAIAIRKSRIGTSRQQALEYP